MRSNFEALRWLDAVLRSGRYNVERAERDIRFLYGELAKGRTEMLVYVADRRQVPLDYREALDMALARLKQLEQEEEDAA